MIDLAEEWRRLDARRRKPDAKAHWDKRAETYSFKDAPDEYLRAFITKAGIAGGERVLDMGCGTGSLSLALAGMGCSVIAADFSEGMLSRVRENAASRGMLFEEAGFPLSIADCSGRRAHPGEDPDEPPFCSRVQEFVSSASSGKVLPLRMSWEDDWAQFGLEADSVDVALASRSLITHDLEDSLKKLSRVAASRVCVTVGTGVSPRIDMRVARAMGLELEVHNDALFVFGIAHRLGYEPTVSYIHSPRMKCYVSPDEAYHSLLRTKEYVADGASQVSSEECSRRLRLFLERHLVERSEGAVRCWTLDEPRVVPWAFIRWDV